MHGTVNIKFIQFLAGQDVFFVSESTLKCWEQKINKPTDIYSSRSSSKYFVRPTTYADIYLCIFRPQLTKQKEILNKIPIWLLYRTTFPRVMFLFRLGYGKFFFSVRNHKIVHNILLNSHIILRSVNGTVRVQAMKAYKGNGGISSTHS